MAPASRLYVTAITLLSCVLVAANESVAAEGVVRHEPGAFEGYTLFAPLRSTTTYLIDMQGSVVHTWKSAHPPGNAVYLLDNGHLLRTAHPPNTAPFHGGGIGGLIEEFDWDGNLVWQFRYANDQHCQHHDVEPMPNGNVLILAWERKSKAEALAAGRDPATLESGELWVDHLIEVKPEGERGGRVVWEWHIWDHLIQDADPDAENFGYVDEHLELIDLNYVNRTTRPGPKEIERLRSLGYVGGAPPRGAQGPPGSSADWNHTNSVDYNPDLDQIVLSVLNFNEIWIIDHSTTTEQAAGHSGGRCGRGGDLLYRWGNPHAYRAGTPDDQRLFAQHDARWIPKGRKGAGHMLVFNNGRGRPHGAYSSVDELVLPLTKDGRYKRSAEAYGPKAATWSYRSAKPDEFFSGHISGAERLPNGNTLICAGEQGRVFEVTQHKKIVWDYASSFGGDLDPRGGPLRGLFGFGFDKRRGGDDGAVDRGNRPPLPGRRGPPRSGTSGHGPDRDEARAMFRATRISSDHPALRDRTLRPRASNSDDVR